MRRIQITLSLLAFMLVLRLPMMACDQSSLCLDSVTPAPGGTFYIYTTLCVGAGITGNQLGAGGNTGRFLFGFSSSTPGFAVTTFTTPIVSQFTSINYNGVNVGAQPAFNAAQAIFYNNTSNWFACVHSTIACGDVHQECVAVRFQVTAVPDSMRVYGIEGGTNLQGGCGGPDMMISFNPNMDNCCVLSGTTSSTPNTSCTVPNGSASFSPNTGLPPYSFSWSNGANTPTISGLSPGYYSLTVSDSIGCVQNLTVTVNNITSPPNSTAVSVTPANCSQSDGGITVAGTGGNGGPYSYVWSTGSTNNSLTNIAPGTYLVTVTDGIGCSHVDSFVIPNAPGPTALVANTTLDNCNMNTGAISLSVSGGTPSYSYLWNNGFTGANPVNLAAGTYSVTVTDNSGCTSVINNIAVGAYSGPVATYSVTQPSCSNSNGMISNTINSGQAPFTFIWNTGATTQSLLNVGNGTYSVTITDGVGCQVIFTNIVLQGTSPVTATYTAVQPQCGVNNGSIQTSVTTGQSPFTYQWSTGTTGASLSNIGNGTYSVTITDANGCSSILSNIQLQGAPSPVVGVATIIDDYCGIGIGGIQTNISGGTPPFTYLWNTGQTGPNLSNLPSGQYSVTVTDALGCLSTITTSVASQAGPSITISSVPATGATNPDGSATAAATGGFPPYTYQWSNGATGATATGLVPGIYTVTITDSYGCAVTDTVVVGFVVGLDQGIEGYFSIFPNPAQDQFTLQRTGIWNDCEVILYDLQGKYLGMREWPASSETLQWNVRNYAAGVYMLQIRSEKGVANFRVQKSN